MKRKKQLLAAMLCAFSMTINSVAVVAQVKDKKQEQKSNSEQGPGVTNLTLPAPPNRFAFIQSEFGFGGPVVKGAPYSAEAVTETIQMLGDGNRIIQNSSSRVFRDSEGRTRREQSLKAIGSWAVSGEAPTMIFINDPVVGVNYNLNSSTKTAHKIMAPQALDNIAFAKISELKLKAANGDPTGVSRAGSAGFGTVATGPTHTTVYERSSSGASLNTFSVTRDPHPVVGAIASGVPMSTPNGVFSWSGEGEVNTESLGRQTIEGVEAEGQRVTATIEAGKIGNERPIVTVNERWYSPELQTVIFSKNSDPRIGETTYKLINIDRSEPDLSLFQVPADYTVEEGAGFGVRPRLMPAAPPTIQRRRPNEN
jgi:hypothetical protein